MRNRLARCLMAVILPACVGACATPHQDATAKTDEFSRTIDITGQLFWVNPFGGDRAHWFIRSWVDKTTHVGAHQLYFEINYDTMAGWRYYEAAADEDANPHKVAVINRDVESCSGGFIGCTYDETIGIDLSDAFLRAHAAGFRIKLSAHSGASYIAAVTAEAVGKQLAALQQAGAVAGGTYTGPTTAGAGVAALAPNAPKIGIVAFPIPATLSTLFNLDHPHGLAIADVTAGGAAAGAGIRKGDVIFECDGRATDTLPDMQAVVTSATPGSAIQCKVWSVTGAQGNKPVFAEKAVSIKVAGQ